MESIKTLQAEPVAHQNVTAITDIMPTVRKLSRADKLLLIQMIAQEIADAEAVRTVEKPTADGDLQESSNLGDVEKAAEEEEDEDDFSLEERINFFKKSPEEQSKILAEQAETMLPYYEQNTEWKEWLAGDIVEY